MTNDDTKFHFPYVAVELWTLHIRDSRLFLSYTDGQLKQIKMSGKINFHCSKDMNICFAYTVDSSHGKVLK